MEIRKKNLILLLVVASGLVLRLWGIDFGLPFQFHQDEPIIVNHALAYGSGDFNPHFFKIPPLTSYILFFIYGACFLTGRSWGLFSAPEDFAVAFFKDPTPFYLLGRLLIGVIPGVLCIIFIYILYRRLFPSQRGAVFAAAVLSFSFSSVLSSHYIYTDMPMLLCVILGILQMAEMLDRPTLKNYILSGIMAGIAVGVKYNAAILIIPFLAAHLIILKSRACGRANTNLIWGIVSSAASFSLVNPYALIDFRSFKKELLTQGGAESYMGWTHHILYSLRESVGMPVLALGLLGLVFIFIASRRKGFFLLSFPVVFYLHLVFFSQPFPRYAAPLMPFLAIGAGFLIFERILPGIRRGPGHTAVVCLIFFIFIPLIAKSIKADILFSSQDTRVEAADWIDNNMDPQAAICVDHTFFRPAVIQNRQQLMDKYKITDKQRGLAELKNRKLQLMLRAREGRRGYYIYFLNPRPEGQGQFLSTMPSLPFDYELLKDKGIDYVVINYANRQEGAGDFYKRLKEDAALVASFSPYKDGERRFSLDTIATTCMPHSSKELYSRRRSGPALEIYKIRKESYRRTLRREGPSDVARATEGFLRSA